MSNIPELDLQLKLLSDEPIFIDDVPVRKVSFNDIAKIGFLRYLQVLGYLTIDADELAEFGDEKIDNAFIFIVSLCSASQQFCKDFIAVCKILFGNTPKSFSSKVIEFDDFLLTLDNFDDVISVIKIRNGMQKSSEEIDENPADKATAELLKRRRALRKKLADAKKSDESGNVTVVDLISVFASISQIPLCVVMEMDMYQLVNQFKRFQIYDNYKTSLEAMMHGAKSEDVDLKYYVRKITDLDNE